MLTVLYEDEGGTSKIDAKKRAISVHIDKIDFTVKDCDPAVH